MHAEGAVFENTLCSKKIPLCKKNVVMFMADHEAVAFNSVLSGFFSNFLENMGLAIYTKPHPVARSQKLRDECTH